MKKILLPLLYVLFVFASCTKNDDTPKGFIQIQKIESNKYTFNFQYNEANLLTRFEVLKSPEAGGARVLYRYGVINFENGKPVSADLFQPKESGSFYRASQFTYQYDPQNRVSITDQQFLDENGNPSSGPNNVFKFEYDSENRPVRYSFANSDRQPYYIFNYDNKGNLIEPEQNYTEYSTTYSKVFEQTYENGINPFPGNGVGLSIFIMYYNNFFTPNELFSAHMPLYRKEVYTMNSDTEVYQVTETSKYVNTFDKDGLLTIMDWESHATQTKNGTVLVDDKMKDTFKFTCIRILP